MLEKNDNSIEATASEKPKEVISEEIINTVAEDAAKIELEEDTQKRLDQVFSGESLKDDPAEKPEESDETTPESEDKKPEVKPDEEEASTLGEQKAEEKDTEVEEKAKDEEADKGKKEVPQLSDAYYRAAIHRGMKPEEIEEFYGNNPELCVKTLGNIYEAVKRSNEEFASLGRAEKERVAKETAAKATPSKAEYKGVDIVALEKADIDPDVLAAIKSNDQQNKVIFDEVQEIRGTRSAPGASQALDTTAQESRLAAQETAAIQQQVRNFFAADDIKLYTDFYGTAPKDDVTWDTLSPGQKANRWAVIEMMDDLMTGARINNRDISIADAMQLAHINISESVSKKVIRQEIMANVLKRSKSLTLKPASSTKTQSDKNSPKSTEELEAATQERLNKISW